MDATPAELLAPHVCSCLLGYKRGGRFQQLFDEAYRYSKDPRVVTWPKHVNDPHPVPRDPGTDARRESLLSGSAETETGLADLRAAFGYLGHRQDQSIYSILCARHGARQQSATRFCRANDNSSAASKENWESGGFSSKVEVARTNVDDITADTVTYHHRGTFTNLDGLTPRSRTSDCLFVLGNGPSLAAVDLKDLRDVDSLGMNAAYRYWDQIDWYPTYYACMDEVVVDSHADEIARLIRESDENGIQRFFVRRCILETQPQLATHPRVTFLETEQLRRTAIDSKPITTGSHSLLWGWSMGYSRIFLLGIDLGYVNNAAVARPDSTLEIADTAGSNPNYFFDGYQQPGDRYNVPNPTPGLHDRAWQTIHDRLPAEIDVFNLNPRSNLQGFPFGEFDQALHEATVTPQSWLPLFPPPIAAPRPTDALVGPYARGAASLEEVHLVRSMFLRTTGSNGTMIDVGAHVGGSLRRFAEDGWRIHAFEPDPANREQLLKNVDPKWDVSIDVRAVSNLDGKSLAFYASPESTGVSGLEPFLDSHEPVAEVETVTLASYLDANAVTQVDFLKVDTEGHDLSESRHRGSRSERARGDAVGARLSPSRSLRVRGSQDAAGWLPDPIAGRVSPVEGLSGPRQRVVSCRPVRRRPRLPNASAMGRRRRGAQCLGQSDRGAFRRGCRDSR